jgi:hypothetical protein
VVVVRPYDHEYGHTEKTSTLLVNSKLRGEYEGLLKDVDAATDVLVKALKEQSGTKKKNLKGELSLSFTKTDDKFFVALARVRDEVFKQKGAPLADVPYDVVFDEKVVTFLEGKDVSSGGV